MNYQTLIFNKRSIETQLLQIDLKLDNVGTDTKLELILLKESHNLHKTLYKIDMALKAYD